MLPFEFVIDGPPVSQQTRRAEKRRDWISKVENEAKSHWPEDELPVASSVMVKIAYFYEENVSPKIDVDNISKPILDALKKTIFTDDTQVTDLLCQKRRLEDIRVEISSDMLLKRLMKEGEFLFIVVQDAPDQEVFNG